jgi:hypothetical protein
MALSKAVVGVVEVVLVVLVRLVRAVVEEEGRGLMAGIWAQGGSMALMERHRLLALVVLGNRATEETEVPVVMVESCLEVILPFRVTIVAPTWAGQQV